MLCVVCCVLCFCGSDLLHYAPLHALFEEVFHGFDDLFLDLWDEGVGDLRSDALGDLRWHDQWAPAALLHDSSNEGKRTV